MKFYTKLCLCLLSLSLVLLGGCDGSNDNETQPTAHEPTPAEIYEAACERVRQADHMILSYTYTEERTVDKETFTRKISGTDSLCNLGTDDMEAVVKQQLTYGSFASEYTELYHAGTAYALVRGSAFFSPMTADAFIARQFPAVAISGGLYENISVSETEEQTLFAFSQPTAAEAWAVPAGDVTFVSAQGSAALDRSGNLMGYSYALSYKYGEVSYRMTLDMEISMPKSLDLTALHPGYPETGASLSCLDAPKMTLQAVGDIFAADSISAEETQTVNSGALNCLRTHANSYHITGRGNDLTALATHKITLEDYNLGATTTTTQTDRYQNGILSRVTNDSAPMENADTPENIRVKWEDPLLNCLFSLNFLSDAVLSETEETYTLTFSGNDSYCAAISSNLRNILGSDLDSLADSYTTPAAGGYLTLSKTTGLPVAMGIHFQRVHVLYGTSYQLSYQLEQKLSLASPETAAILAEK